MRSLKLLLLVLLVGGCGARSALDEGELCQPALGGEVCDGRDNDCDGLVDEEIAPITCGQGSCITTVSCQEGVMPACVPPEPEPEMCNLRDDDCDGLVDEGFGFGPVGDPMLLRSDEGITGDCTSCAWAWGSRVVPIDSGLMTLWRVGIYGGQELPNVSGRRVNEIGTPLEPVQLLMQEVLLELNVIKWLPPLPPKGMPFEARYRVGSDDVPGLLFVNGSGQVEPIIGVPTGGYSRDHTVWTGERFITAWEQDDELRVAVLFADGSLDKIVDVDPLERPAAITLAVYPGRVGILVSRYRDDPERRDSWFIRLDALGHVVTPAHEIAAEYRTWQRLVGTSEGWLHMRPNNYMEPSTRQRLGIDGDPLDEAYFFEDNRSLQDSGLADIFVARPGLGEMFGAWMADSGGDMHVEFLNDAGKVLRGWSGPPPPTPGFDFGGFGSPHVALLEDRLLLVWHGFSEDFTPNQVWAQSFGCVP